MNLRPFFLLLLAIAFSCNNPEKKSISIARIEISVTGEAGGRAYNIDRYGVVKKCIFSRTSGQVQTQCYTDTLTSAEIDSINYLLKGLRQSKTDSLYQGGCLDCPVYRVNIAFDDYVINTTIEGTADNDKQVLRFVKYITGLRVYEGTKTDSIFVFSTLKFPSDSF